MLQKCEGLVSKLILGSIILVTLSCLRQDSEEHIGLRWRSQELVHFNFHVRKTSLASELVSDWTYFLYCLYQGHSLDFDVNFLTNSFRCFCPPHQYCHKYFSIWYYGQFNLVTKMVLSSSSKAIYLLQYFFTISPFLSSVFIHLSE